MKYQKREDSNSQLLFLRNPSLPRNDVVVVDVTPAVEALSSAVKPSRPPPSNRSIRRTPYSARVWNGIKVPYGAEKPLFLKTPHMHCYSVPLPSAVHSKKRKEKKKGVFIILCADVLLYLVPRGRQLVLHWLSTFYPCELWILQTNL